MASSDSSITSSKLTLHSILKFWGNPTPGSENYTRSQTPPSIKTMCDGREWPRARHEEHSPPNPLVGKGCPGEPGMTALAYHSFRASWLTRRT
jgi:hypothetical protein